MAAEEAEAGTDFAASLFDSVVEVAGAAGALKEKPVFDEAAVKVFEENEVAAAVVTLDLVSAPAEATDVAAGAPKVNPLDVIVLLFEDIDAAAELVTPELSDPLTSDV